MAKIPTVIGDAKTGWSKWQTDDTKNGDLFLYCCNEKCRLCHQWQFRVSADGLPNIEWRVRVDERKTAAARREARKRRRK